MRIEAAERLASEPKFRGCASISLAAQETSPSGAVHALVRNRKDWIRSICSAIVEDMRAAWPDVVALQLLVLWDGVIVEAYVQQSCKPIEVARGAVDMILGEKL